MSTQRETRALFLKLFQEGRFIPKIQALADAAKQGLPGATGRNCQRCETEGSASGGATCPVCNRCFEFHHPRNHHVSDRSLSVNSVCVNCGEALALGDIVASTSVEILPCSECYPNMSVSDLKDTTYYFQI
jgi:hypothetical protein